MEKSCKKWTIVVLLFFFFFGPGLHGQVTISTDFTNPDLQMQAMENVWTVVNRISPKNGANTRSDLKVNLVRMIGGINKVVDGKKVPDLEFDPCHYDSLTNTYIYNWQPLIQRLDKIVNSQVSIHQIVLDQPPWAFQHGYTFIGEGEIDSIHFREDERITRYGNALPPADKEAYHDFIKALMTKLIQTYGIELVQSWRFRIGSEIETPEHWKGTEQDFIEHFANTERAIRAILPEAKIVVHTRKPDFIYREGTVPNYKGEVIKSFADGLIEYCSNNNVRYDYWGISDYVITTRAEDRIMTQKYDKLFAPLINHPQWNNEAKLDIMEYNTITTMNGIDGKGLIPCATSHKEIIELAFAQQFYKYADKGLESIYRWGNRPGSKDPVNIEMLSTMNGQIRYKIHVIGSPQIANNELNAFFGKSTNDDVFDILLYNYNAESMDDEKAEDIVISFTIDNPVGTVLYYRSLSYGKENNKLQSFLENEPSSGWIKTGFDRHGDPTRTLNEAGTVAYNNYVHTNVPRYGSWQAIKTIERTDGKEGSQVQINSTIGSFAFEKFEFRLTPGTTQQIKPATLIWTSDTDFQDFSFRQLDEVISNNHLTLNITGNYPALFYNNPIPASLYGAFRIVLKNKSESDIFYFAFYKNDIKYQLRFNPETNQNSFSSYVIDLKTNTNWRDSISYFQIETGNKVGTGVVTIDTIEFIPKNENILNVNLQTEGIGYLNYSSGTCFSGQEFELEATPGYGWEFEGWTGDIESSANPLKIIVTNDMFIHAVFKENVNTSEGSILQEKAAPWLTVFPNPSSGILNITSDHLGNVQYRLFSLGGREMCSGNFKHHTTIEIKEAGLYLLLAQRENNICTYNMIAIQ